MCTLHDFFSSKVRFMHTLFMHTLLRDQIIAQKKILVRLAYILVLLKLGAAFSDISCQIPVSLLVLTFYHDFRMYLKYYVITHIMINNNNIAYCLSCLITVLSVINMILCVPTIYSLHISQRYQLFTVLILSMKQLIITSITQVKFMYVHWMPLRHLIGLTY